MDAHRIAPKLHIGSTPPARIKEHDFDMVVLCANEDQRDRDVPTIKVGLIDTEDPMDRADITRALHAAHQINLARFRGMRVLVACQAGVNRSSFVAALALILKGWTPGGAIDRIRERRKPPIGMKPLENRRFVRVLYSIARTGSRRWTGFRGSA